MFTWYEQGIKPFSKRMLLHFVYKIYLKIIVTISKDHRFMRCSFNQKW